MINHGISLKEIKKTKVGSLSATIKLLRFLSVHSPRSSASLDRYTFFLPYMVKWCNYGMIVSYS